MSKVEWGPVTRVYDPQTQIRTPKQEVGEFSFVTDMTDMTSPSLFHKSPVTDL